MERQTRFAQAAERKADEPAFRFMSSSDVVGEMSPARAVGSAARRAEGAAVTRTAPEGAAQGGVIDWFRRKFGKKPVSLDDPSAKGFNGYRIQQGSEADKNQRFMTTQSRAIYQMAQNATPEQLRGDTALRKLILDDYRTNMAARLKGFDDKDYDTMFSSIFRGKSTGELSSFNMLLRASMPENFIEDLDAKFDETGDRDAVLDTALEKFAEDRELLQVLRAGMEGFGDSVHFSGENQGRRSAMLMNHLMLRAIVPGFTQRGVEMRDAEADRQGATREADAYRHAVLVKEALDSGVGMEQVKRGVQLQDAVRLGPSASEGGKRFLAFLNRWDRR